MIIYIIIYTYQVIDKNEKTLVLKLTKSKFFCLKKLIQKSIHIFLLPVEFDN